MKDKSLESISTWSKGKQVKRIEQLVSVYPTAKEFKKAVLSTNDPKSTNIVKMLDDNADRSTYIDFLQNVFIKHSSTGRHLLNSLVSLGAGAGLAYLGAKEAKKYAMDKKGITDQTAAQALNATKTGKTIGGLSSLINDDIKGIRSNSRMAIDKAIADDPLLATQLYLDKGDTEALKTAALGAATRGFTTGALTKGNIGRKIGHGFVSAISPDNADVLAVNTAENDQKKLRQYMKAGAGAGLVGGGVAGGGITNAIQRWREKKLQKKLDALKNS